MKRQAFGRLILGVAALLTLASVGSGEYPRVEANASASVSEGTLRPVGVDPDTTPPVARIDSPAYESCAFGYVAVHGVACDFDGDYGMDKLEYLAVDAPLDTPWTLIGSYTQPKCESGYLYPWNTSALAAGEYFLRLTVTNAAGLSSAALVKAHVGKPVETVEIRFPEDAAVVGGQVCVDGTVWDRLCLDSYAVEYQPAGGEWFYPVDPSNAEYYTSVVTDPLGCWDTRGRAVDDGAYTLRVAASNECYITTTVSRSVIVDNTAPTAQIVAPEEWPGIGEVIEIHGTADDSNLRDWVLDFTGGAEHDWVTIASGITSVNDGLLGEWDTSELAESAYTLRLRVWDTAILEGNSDLHNQSSDMLSVSFVSCAGFDTDDDDDVDLLDFAAFQGEFTGPPPGP